MRFYFVSIDTERLRQRLNGRSASSALAALGPAASDVGIRVLDACVVPVGLRALLVAAQPRDVRALGRRYVARAAGALRIPGVVWRPTIRVARVAPGDATAWRGFITRCRMAFLERSTMPTPSTIDQPTCEAARPKRRKTTNATVRSGAATMRVIDRVVDAQLGADESAARVRRYVADHDAPANDATAFARLCEVIFAQGIGFTIVARKRAALARAFANFGPSVLAGFGESDIMRLLGEPIIRNRSKIVACIENARRWCAIVESHGSYLARVAEVAAQDDPASGWPALAALLAADFERINEVGARQTLKRWGFFTAFGHPGSRRVIERLGLVDARCAPTAGQLMIGAISQALSRDAYSVEATLALFAALGPCNPAPQCPTCELCDRCPTGVRRRVELESGAPSPAGEPSSGRASLAVNT
ncbi:MAG TPA: DNA-3-methyladenine glycosylase I [Candidatus Eremiobacteraceae bacterium]|nr:DNA-3-methyladenine glycosylase I [Candidatus Eremiobacteraceae bacterium]